MCAGLTEEDLKEAINAGFNTLTKLMYETGASLGCSTCQEDVEQILIETNRCKWKPPEFPLPILKSS